MTRAYLIVAALFAIVSYANGQCKEMTQCRYRWCMPEGRQSRITPRILLRDPEVATIPFVCIPEDLPDGTTLNRTVRVFRSGTAIVQPILPRMKVRPDPVPITRFRPRKMFPSFKKDQFFFREVGFPPLRNRFGLARRVSRGNQEDFLNNLCVTLPLLQVGIEESDGSLTRVRGKRDSTSCVAFQSEVASILVELTWNTGDNFDLSVIDPNGDIVDKDNSPSVTGGKLIKDNNLDMCELPTGREQVNWNQDRDLKPIRGQYTVKVRHTARCNKKKPTRWELAVIVKGQIVLFKGGVSRRPGRFVITATFDFP